MSKEYYVDFKVVKKVKTKIQADNPEQAIERAKETYMLGEEHMPDPTQIFFDGFTDEEAY